MCQDLEGVRGYRPSPPSLTDSTPSFNAASAISSCRWVTGRRASPGACKSDSTTAKPQMAVASLSTSFLSQCQELLILEPFFLAHLQGFLYAQRKHWQADTCNATVGRRPPACQQDYTFFTASCDQEAGGSSVGAPPPPHPQVYTN